MTAPKCIVIANRKGGTGKSTVSYNLGAAYALAGRRVCLIDLDSQANLTQLCRVNPVSLEDYRRITPVPMSDKLSILPATKQFSQLEDEINRMIDRNAYIRTEILPKLKGFYVAIFDTSPSLSVLNVNAFCIADQVYVIVNADSFSLMGLAEMESILGQVKGINPGMAWSIVLNAAHKKRSLTTASLNALRGHAHYSGIEIPNRQHFADSNALKRPALELPEILARFNELVEL